tara:strand:+ start:663 stop:2444 length:1782 start_codon:yes stop_codon:yes gene_type:complete
MKPNADNLLKATQMASTMTPMSGTTGMMTTGAMRMGPALKGAISNRELEIFERSLPDSSDNLSFQQRMNNLQAANTMNMIGQTKGAISNAEMELFEQAQMSTDPEEREGLMALIEKLQAQANAPMGEIAQELAAMGGGEDTALAHVRPGEVVVPPEIVQDPEVESLLESKFNQMGINPEEAVVGIGIASLNPNTGLEQFGFFKKIGKKLGKVVKKVAPIAALVPGVGTALGGVLGGIGGLATKIPGIGGALGNIGSTIAGGIAKAGIPGISSIAGGTSGGFGGIMDALTTKSGLLGGGMFGETGSKFLGGPEAGKGFANRFGLGSGTAGQVEAFQAAEQAKATLNAMTPDQLASMDPAKLKELRDVAFGAGSKGNILSRIGGSIQRSGGIGGILGGGAGTGTGGGGFGDMLKMGGIGALAAGLGKLAYDEAKDQRGVELTPLTTMDATGRYNIEAEIARRMGQPAPNPVEFGLLPEGTLPELSGGKPRGMYGGGMVMPMAYAEGGNVAMEDFERMNGRIDGPGTETSDDIPAMLSDGEFVMTGRAVRGAGSFDMQNSNGIVTLTPNGSPDRESGTDLMYQLMEVFSGQARPSA